MQANATSAKKNVHVNDGLILL